MDLFKRTRSASHTPRGRSSGDLPRGTEAALALTVTLALAFAAGSPGLAQQADAGLDTFVANGCHQCHGYEGQGGAAGPRIAPSVYPYELFARLVRRPVNAMPAYAPGVLADTDLREIYDYVRSVPAPPAVDEIDILAEHR